jgi:hypothetical protein
MATSIDLKMHQKVKWTPKEHIPMLHKLAQASSPSFITTQMRCTYASPRHQPAQYWKPTWTAKAAHWACQHGTGRSREGHRDPPKGSCTSCEGHRAPPRNLAITVAVATAVGCVPEALHWAKEEGHKLLQSHEHKPAGKRATHALAHQTAPVHTGTASPQSSQHIQEEVTTVQQTT